MNSRALFTGLIVTAIYASQAFSADLKPGQYLVRTDKSSYSPGDIMRISVKADAKDFANGTVFLWGALASPNIYQTTLELNESTGLYEGSLEIPKFVASKDLELAVEIENKVGTETYLKGGEHFNNPQIKGFTTDGAAPVISHFKIMRTQNRTVKVSFDVSDNIALQSCQLYLHQNSQNMGQADEDLKSKKFAHCELEVPFPEITSGAPGIIVSAEDHVGNKFDLHPEVDWNGLNVDGSPVKIENLRVVSCAGGVAKLSMSVSGGAGVKNASVGILSANSGRLSQADFELDASGEYVAFLSLPKVIHTKSPQILVSAEGKNGADALVSLPEGAIDFAGIPVNAEQCKVTYLSVENAGRFKEEIRDLPQGHKK
jgi:hypothetical protein